MNSIVNNVRLPMRNRASQRPKVNSDENANSRHVVTGKSSVAGTTRSSTVNVNALKHGPQRAALGEVTTTTVNRKQDTDAQRNTVKGKEVVSTEAVVKRSRSSSLAAAAGAQRVPQGPGRSATMNNLPASTRPLAVRHSRNPSYSRQSQRIAVAVDPIPESEPIVVKHEDMDIEESRQTVSDEEASPQVIPREIETIVENEVEVEKSQSIKFPVAKPARVWPALRTARADRYREQIENIREHFEDELDEDPNMVSEYSEEIFQYMQELEEDSMPNPDYMNAQGEINWSMRQTLIDWLLQVHLRYHMVPETLWIAVNIVDRFLTKRVVSLAKLQLVGVTAMLIAAKYEEILAPAVDEFVIITENGYSRQEILEGERIVLQMLDFKVSQYCSPYSWMRKISKADNYEVQTRTLSKFLTEVTLLDYRFLRVKPSMIAAIGMYSARRMLNGDWDEAFVYHSGFTEEHLLPGHAMLVQKLCEADFEKLYVCRKYAHKRFLKASVFAIEWARANFEEEGNMDDMVLSE